jgi:hypothetical protein
MRNTILWFTSFLLFGSFLLAQSPEQKPDPNTLTGCLKRADNEYMLTDDEGTAHLLMGSNKKLSRELGHEVEITGKPGTRTDDFTVPGGASNTIERKVFDVKTIKHLADFCR